MPKRKEVWYTDAYTGFYAVRLTNGAWPDAEQAGAAPRRCVSRRVIDINVRGVRRGSVVRKLTVYVNGERLKVQTGSRRSVRISFRGVTSDRGAVKKVKIVATLRTGRTVVDRRTYHLCIPGGG
ncbi:MAG: hypothetical protein H0U79_02680 [Solirubrobacterales bacterium]|nr:hypothetical protein [Solirubrobacterales bacterium]